ncbi:UNVERIFIED_CONTAM: hypothetical protein GTU68_067102, partial [Idotea baltica]|nr:hypothetical protein [Idotea baltica]
MFDSIAKKYDLGNSVLSFGTHFIWRKQLLSMLPKAIDKKVVDICTGTGDLLPILSKRFSGGNSENVIGLDFSANMLSVCREKHSEFKVIQGDALNLPFEDNSFDVASVSFGVRNYADLEIGLSEIYRILKPGASVLILEFGQPKVPVFSSFYKLYSKYIMPIIGGFITGNRDAYEYL